MTALLCVLSAALALDLEPSASASLGASYWYDGVQAEGAASLRLPFWERREGDLFGDSGLKASAITSVSPSYVRVGPKITLAPLAILNVSAWYQRSVYFGTFTSLIGFEDPNATHTPEELELATLRGERRGGTQTSFGGSATLQGKVGPVIFAVVGETTFWRMHQVELRGDYYFEPESSVLLATQDQTWGTTAVLAAERSLEGDRVMRVGLINTQVLAVETGDENIRLGPLWTLDTEGGRWGYVVLAQAHVRDRDFPGVLPPFVAAQVTHRWGD
jgi:hypothetical protein